MKRYFFSFSISIIMIVMLLSGCSQAVDTSETNVEDIAQTLAALAFTQTALADIPEPPVVAPEPEETELPPEPTEIIEPTETIAPTIINHQIIPGEPGVVRRRIFDTDSSRTANTRSASHGDDYNTNLYERPFTEIEMIYRPDVDILRAEISEDTNFYYVKIFLHNIHPEGGFQAAYAVEIDENMDGRGDLLIMVERPASSSWDISGVSVWKDSNNDVGGTRILRPDTNYSGNGYELEVFSLNVLTDPDTAWARVSTSPETAVTIAFKKSLLPRNAFVWGVWAAEDLLDPARFDHHDHFTLEEAGSPYSWHTAYPLKALNLIDNTCRETFNFTPTTPIPGLCSVVEPTPTLPPQATATPEIENGNISVVAFDDMNNDGVRQPGEPLTIYANEPPRITIYLHPSTCANPAIASTMAASYTFADLPPGTYCVRITGGGSMTTASSFIVTLSAGETIFLAFGFSAPI